MSIRISDDIFDGIAAMRVAFKKAGMEAPSVILLESPEEGRRFLACVRQSSLWKTYIGSPDLGKPIEMADGSVWMELEVMGLKVRWPSNKIAMPDGSWRFA